jgi:ubiquinone biosynthesis protein UbiJ
MAQVLVPSFIINALNHLIAQESWAQELLLPHSSKVISVTTPLGQVLLMINEGSFANARDEDVSPSVSIEISKDAIWAFLKEGKPTALKYIRISGDVDLAADLNHLVADLKWEAEEDLAQLIGDASSHMIFRESRKIIHQGQTAVLGLQTSVRDYLVHEKNVLVDKNHFAQFKSDLRQLRDHLDRTEKKVALLERQILDRVKN